MSKFETVIVRESEGQSRSEAGGVTRALAEVLAATRFEDLPGDVMAEDSDRAPELDVLGVNAYRGRSMTDLYDQVKARLGKPILFTEFGADADKTLLVTFKKLGDAGDYTSAYRILGLAGLPNQAIVRAERIQASADASLRAGSLR